MKKYMFTIKLEGYKMIPIPVDLDDRSPSRWKKNYRSELFYEKTLTSKILDFPNELREGDPLTFNETVSPLCFYVPKKILHNFGKGYSLLDFGVRGCEDKSDKILKKRFKKLIKDYSFLKNLE